MWVSTLALFFSAAGLLCCVWLYFQLLGKLSKGDLKASLAQSSEELSKTYARSVKEMETEWDNMYEKFARLAGRMDRKKALESPPPPPNETSAPITRADLMRRRK
jgi:hypothetical protein